MFGGTRSWLVASCGVDLQKRITRRPRYFTATQTATDCRLRRTTSLARTNFHQTADTQPRPSHDGVHKTARLHRVRHHTMRPTDKKVSEPHTTACAAHRVRGAPCSASPEHHTACSSTGTPQRAQQHQTACSSTATPHRVQQHHTRVQHRTACSSSTRPNHTTRPKKVTEPRDHPHRVHQHHTACTRTAASNRVHQHRNTTPRAAPDRVQQQQAACISTATPHRVQQHHTACSSITTPNRVHQHHTATPRTPDGVIPLLWHSRRRNEFLFIKQFSFVTIFSANAHVQALSGNASMAGTSSCIMRYVSLYFM